ncbi:F0F1 ATP synthase subunit gamma [Marinobacter sp. F4218]|uniref:F0F1 ATP synthase subunit gamma n=1 Tax=Marinobacter sp. F4218 TaxID=2862868 RepID=UPI001C630684|nr:FoF1 ATP synthase subunit gamma [Marinobacter sp. F4218]MBW7472063.1 F0F1 ATP synthase subunit gamma [Marinobacter sp. F4218]
MAQTFEALSHHDDTLTGIRSIVHTMKTLSAINAVPYERAATSIEAYHNTILSGLQALLAGTGPIALPSVEPEEKVLVVFGSDHGLCGSYNETVAQAVVTAPELLAAEHPGLRILCVGAQMNDALTGLGITSEAVLLPPASAAGIGRLASDIVTRLDTIGRGDPHNRLVATLAFMQRADHGQQRPAVTRLLPLAPSLVAELAERPWVSRSLPIHSLSSDQVFAALLRSHIFASVFRASAEAIVTENAARLARMQQAERSVDDQLEQVKGQMRSVRQEEITTELLDVIIGFEALQGRERRS